MGHHLPGDEQITSLKAMVGTEDTVLGQLFRSGFGTVVVFFEPVYHRSAVPPVLCELWSVFRVSHSISKACIGIEGFQNQELILVDATSILVWLLIGPMCYSTAEIVCPKGGYTPLVSWFCGTISVTPIPEQTALVEGHNSRSNMSSVMLSAFDDAVDKTDNFEDSAQGSVYSLDESFFCHESESDDLDSRRNIDAFDALHGFSFHFDDCTTTEAEIALRSANQPDNSATAVVIAPTLRPSTLMEFSRTLQYVWSCVWLVFSTDVLIVYAIVAYQSRFQSMDSALKLRSLRANERWSFQTIRQSLERFQIDRLGGRSASSWNRRSPSPFLASSSETSVRLPITESDPTKLPPYYRFCLMVQKELCESLRILYILRRLRISTPLSYLLAFSGIGHGFTEVGRRYWIIVMRKYIISCFVCVGIWFDETHKAYNIEDLVKTFTIRVPEEATMEFIKLAIASRVILLQALGTTTTLISIIVITTCEAPLFVFSPKLRKTIPPLLHLDSRKAAIERERAELRGREVEGSEEEVPVEEWVIKTRALSIFLTESRLIVFLYNLVSLSLTVMILKGVVISIDIIALLLIAMLPYYVGSTLIPILYIGKRLNLKDEDFRVVFLSWLSRPYAYCRSAVVCMWGSSFGRLITHLGHYNRPQSVQPFNQSENNGEDDISMSSESIGSLIDDSICSDHESSCCMDDESIDVVIEEDGDSIMDSDSSQQVSDLYGDDDDDSFLSHWIAMYEGDWDGGSEKDADC